MQIIYINNYGKGFGGKKTIEAESLGELFAIEMPGEDSNQYQIKLNGQVGTRTDALKEGDRVTITPAKQEGG